MKRRIMIPLVALCIVCAGSVTLARRAAPPETVWGKSNNGKFEYKTLTRTGQVTVYKTGDRENPLWQVNIPQFGTFFSEVLLADGGNYLLHIRGNHQVWRVTDTGIHVVKRDGSLFKLKVNEFIDTLVVTERRTSVDPKYRWINAVEKPADQSFTLINAKGEKKEVFLKDLKTKMPQQSPEGDRPKAAPEE